MTKKKSNKFPAKTRSNPRYGVADRFLEQKKNKSLGNNKSIKIKYPANKDKPFKEKREKQEWIYGKNAVNAVLKNASRKISRILMTHDRFKSLDRSLVKAYSKDIEIVESRQISKIIGSKDKHQNASIKAGDLIEKTPLDVLLQKNSHEKTVILVLDEIQDPQNIGAIIRSAYCFNATAIVITKHNSPSINCSVIRASAGYSEVLPIYFVSNLSYFLKKIHGLNFVRFGLDVMGDTLLGSDPFSSYDKICFVLGSESRGMKNLTKYHCDQLIRIEMNRNADSLNVTNATAIVLHQTFINS